MDYKSEWTKNEEVGKVGEMVISLWNSVPSL